jgi:hypothetical protein
MMLKIENRSIRIRIETMQRLLEAPKTNMTTFTDQELTIQHRPKDPEPDTAEAKHDGLTTPEQTENKRIPVPEHVEPGRKEEVGFLPNG